MSVTSPCLFFLGEHRLHALCGDLPPYSGNSSDSSALEDSSSGNRIRATNWKCRFRNILHALLHAPSSSSSRRPLIADSCLACTQYAHSRDFVTGRRVIGSDPLRHDALRRSSCRQAACAPIVFGQHAPETGPRSRTDHRSKLPEKARSHSDKDSCRTERHGTWLGHSGDGKLADRKPIRRAVWC